MEMHEKHGTPLNGHETSHQQGGGFIFNPSEPADVQIPSVQVSAASERHVIGRLAIGLENASAVRVNLASR